MYDIKVYISVQIGVMIIYFLIAVVLQQIIDKPIMESMMYLVGGWAVSQALYFIWGFIWGNKWK